MHSTFSDTDSPIKQFVRILLGIAMILIALTFMSQVSSGLASSDLIRIIISSLDDELLIALLLFAILTWVAHTSIAILLFWASLVHAGITADPALIVAAILGINLGNAISPIIMTWLQATPARRIVFGHAGIKLAGVILGFIFLSLIDGVIQRSSAHLDLIPDMRWINTQVASIGNDVLPETDASGDEIADLVIAHHS